MGVLPERIAAVERREPMVLATVVQTTGASPTQAGLKLLVRADGTKSGNAGGGALEEHIRLDALQTLAEIERVRHGGLASRAPAIEPHRHERTVQASAGGQRSQTNPKPTIARLEALGMHRCDI